jgi:triacylglycerol esterase/lipase EstA (alpha/beta hydrolase family)
MDYLERLKDAGIGERGVMWVCHSMGGLIVKYIINLALSSDDPKIRQIGENSRGIVFLGVPHRGSIVAKLSHQTTLLWPTVEVKDLEENSKELLKLNEQFLDNVLNMKTPVEVVSIAEGASTKIFQNIKLHVVPITSSYLGFGDFYISHENHLNLSKPLSQNSFIYLTVVNMIEKILKQTKKS